jgi:Icc-related predicted phosphoesterase
MKLVAISDVHCRQSRLVIPPCDILISAGDYSFKGEKHVVEDYHKWLNKQDARHVVSVQGNHELWVEENFQQAKEIAEKACPGVHFIGSGQAVDIEGTKIYGSAVTPYFHDWAWNSQRGPEIAAEWAKIPEDTEILITHGPPQGILDVVCYADGTPKERVGCYDLFLRTQQLKNLKIHIFGHIHSAHGQKYFNGKYYYNASICGETYAVDYEPTVIDYEK